MKHYIRMFVLLFALLWVLAWSAARQAKGAEKGEETPIAQSLEQPADADAARMLRVLHGGEIEEMSMENYLRGVLRAEMPASFEFEALKAQAIAARTYTLYRMQFGEIAAHPDADACDNINCCKAYMTAETASEGWGDMAVYYEEKIDRAVSETDGQVVLYGGEPILAVFCSSVGGGTQNAGAVWMSDLPYLQSVSSPESEELVPNYYSVVTFSAEEFKALVRGRYPNADFSGSCGSWIGGIERNDAGYVTSVRVGGVRMRGNDLRAVLSLRSPCFTIEIKDSAFTFRVTGYGHGVGMSQYGANALAKSGAGCEEILTHYYTGTAIGSWQSERNIAIRNNN